MRNYTFNHKAYFSNQYFALLLLATFNLSSISAQNNEKVKIAFLGTFHFNQMHDVEKPGRNFFSDLKQQETLVKMNTPQNIELSHRLLFNIPAYVQKGSFSSYENIDKTAIDTNYIGAEFISLFYERNLKIYSNILNTQLADNNKRILVITGQVHVGILQDLLGKNPNYEIIDINTL